MLSFVIYAFIILIRVGKIAEKQSVGVYFDNMARTLSVELT